MQLDRLLGYRPVREIYAGLPRSECLLYDEVRVPLSAGFFRGCSGSNFELPSPYPCLLAQPITHVGCHQ